MSNLESQLNYMYVYAYMKNKGYMGPDIIYTFRCPLKGLKNVSFVNKGRLLQNLFYLLPQLCFFSYLPLFLPNYCI
jgi:hypothetical protein